MSSILVDLNSMARPHWIWQSTIVLGLWLTSHQSAFAGKRSSALEQNVKTYLTVSEVKFLGSELFLVGSNESEIKPIKSSIDATIELIKKADKDQKALLILKLVQHYDRLLMWEEQQQFQNLQSEISGKWRTKISTKPSKEYKSTLNALDQLITRLARVTAVQQTTEFQLLQAKLYLRKGNLDQAFKAFDRSLKGNQVDDRYRSALIYLLHLYLTRNDLDNAEYVIKKIKATTKRSRAGKALAEYWQGWYLIAAQGLSKEVLAHWRSALSKVSTVRRSQTLARPLKDHLTNLLAIYEAKLGLKRPYLPPGAVSSPSARENLLALYYLQGSSKKILRFFKADANLEASAAALLIKLEADEDTVSLKQLLSDSQTSTRVMPKLPLLAELLRKYASTHYELGLEGRNQHSQAAVGLLEILVKYDPRNRSEYRRKLAQLYKKLDAEEDSAKQHLRLAGNTRLPKEERSQHFNEAVGILTELVHLQKPVDKKQEKLAGKLVMAIDSYLGAFPSLEQRAQLVLLKASSQIRFLSKAKGIRSFDSILQNPTDATFRHQVRVEFLRLLAERAMWREFDERYKQFTSNSTTDGSEAEELKVIYLHSLSQRSKGEEKDGDLVRAGDLSLELYRQGGSRDLTLRSLKKAIDLYRKAGYSDGYLTAVGYYLEKHMKEASARGDLADAATLLEDRAFYPEAAKIYEALSNAYPGDSRAADWRIHATNLYFLAEDPAGLKRMLRFASEDDNIEDLEFRAKAMEKLGRDEAALEYYQKIAANYSAETVKAIDAMVKIAEFKDRKEGLASEQKISLGEWLAKRTTPAVASARRVMANALLNSLSEMEKTVGVWTLESSTYYDKANQIVTLTDAAQKQLNLLGKLGNDRLAFQGYLVTINIINSLTRTLNDTMIDPQLSFVERDKIKQSIAKLTTDLDGIRAALVKQSTDYARANYLSNAETLLDIGVLEIFPSGLYQELPVAFDSSISGLYRHGGQK